MDYGSVVDTVSAADTVIARFLAVGAYTVARRQSRITFELEILRELADVLRFAPDDEAVYRATGLAKNAISSEFNSRYIFILSEHIHHRAGHLLTLIRHKNSEELATWEACRKEEWNKVDAASFPKKDGEELRSSIFYRRGVERKLRAELLEAIRRRMN